MKKYIKLIYILLIMIVLFNFNKVFAMENNYFASNYKVTKIGANLCDSDYTQVGNSNVCEKKYVGKGSQICDMATGICSNNCNTDFAKHDKEACVIVGDISAMGNIYNGTCVCQYYMPGTGGKHHNDDYDDYDGDDSVLTNPEEWGGSDFDRDNVTITPPDFSDCHSLLGDGSPGTPAYYVVISFKVIRYVAIILLVGLSVMDLIGATTSGDAEALSKVTKKIMLRFVLCVVIFLLPTLVKYVLQYVHKASTDLCGL